MIRFAVLLALTLSGNGAAAEGSLTTLTLIRPMAIIGRDDLARLDQTVPGTLSNRAEAVGLEARVTLYPGRPIRPGDVGPAALIERNQPVLLVFRTGGLSMMTEGRALDRGAEGDSVRVMNQASRTTISGTVQADGTVRVGREGIR